ncbi:MAG TPA: Crp/Fnr family transcriptional regulator [Pyrinomonadaceae bacterium]|jgi:CRP-like cAMP-binding protein
MLSTSQNRNLQQTKKLKSENSQINNVILSRLPEKEYKELLPDLQFLELKSHDVIHRPHEHIEYVYFPENSLISSVTVFEDGTSVETGTIGREGMTGVTIALSKKQSPRESIVQIPGEGWRIKADRFQAALKREGLLAQLASEFIFAFLTEAAQCAACNSHHEITARLAKWLLISSYKTGRTEFHLTQDFLAQMLGVHRPGVTLVAINLKEAGLINYRRGIITITDKEGLEEQTCECYEAIKSQYESYATV